MVLSYEIERQKFGVTSEYHRKSVSEIPYHWNHSIWYSRLSVVDFDREQIEAAAVTLNAQEALTNENGVYKIENISPGSHKIKIMKDDWEFDNESEVIVASSNPTIETIKPSKVAVCPKSNSGWFSKFSNLIKTELNRMNQ